MSLIALSLFIHTPKTYKLIMSEFFSEVHRINAYNVIFRKGTDI